MFDLSLMSNQTFLGAVMVALTLSASMFAMFLFLVLYLQNVLGLSALETGVRFLPLSGISFFAAAFSGRMTARLPARVLMGTGMSLVTIGLALMLRVDVGESWTALIPGFLVGGIGIGMVNPSLASTAVAVVEVHRSGMASGINSTFRQVGIATGIAGLGAVFRSSAENELYKGFKPITDGPVAAHKIAESISRGGNPADSSGDIGHVSTFQHVVEQAFVTSLHHTLYVSVCIAAVGTVFAWATIREKDMASSPLAHLKQTSVEN
jgi:hypothetical protein